MTDPTPERLAEPQLPEPFAIIHLGIEEAFTGSCARSPASQALATMTAERDAATGALQVASETAETFRLSAIKLSEERDALRAELAGLRVNAVEPLTDGRSYEGYVKAMAALESEGYTAQCDMFIAGILFAERAHGIGASTEGEAP